MSEPTTVERLVEIVRQFQVDHPDEWAELPDGPTRPDGLARGILWAIRQYDPGPLPCQAKPLPIIAGGCSPAS